MSKQINTQEIDQLRQHLVVPLAVTNILNDDIAIQPDMHYGLHLALSEVDPDSALLAIALCASDIANKTIKTSHIALALQKETMDIINDYAPTWMHNNMYSPMPSSLYEELLETIPEDLESLADLMDALYNDVENENHEIATLLKLLSIQARAHMEIADFVLAEIVYEKETKNQRHGKDNKAEFIYAQQNITQELQNANTDNIIIFPGTRT